MHASTQSKREERQALKAAGWTQHEVWLDPETQRALAAFREPGESLRETIRRALELAAAVKQTHQASHTEPPTLATVPTVSASPRQEPRHQSSTMTSQCDRSTVLARVEELYEQLGSYQAVAQQLQAEGVPTRSGRGRWDPSSVRLSLKRHP